MENVVLFSVQKCNHIALLHSITFIVDSQQKRQNICSSCVRTHAKEESQLNWCTVRHEVHIKGSDRFILLSGTWATRQLMMCAVNTDFCIIPDKAGIVDSMILLWIRFHLHCAPCSFYMLFLLCLHVLYE